ncbi:protein phosphatase 2C domain-containing protein [Paenibacillus koleovorans]|uniref:protein phosphatase 2C domain-containing protein n=1 Tax=Paenibacillus koleovorans TaxID=121608 RepID=UPI000FD6D53A|nr:protein phosphatase 2C domain-containing protein [Paenibacillus koleovorans]
MRYTHFHLKSPLKAETEDAFAIQPATGIYAVLDGVTPLHDYRDAEGHNGAHIAAQLFKSKLERPDVDPAMPLTDLVNAANRDLRQLMLKAGVDLTVLHELWSTCVAAVRVRETEAMVDFAQLGDSMIVAVYRDGTFKSLTENRVQGVTSRSAAYREAARRDGADLPDEAYFDIPKHRYAYNRTLANRPEGYGVANGMPDIGVHLQHGTIPLDGLSSLLLFTDGFFHPDYELEKAAPRMIELGFEAYVDEVVAAEKSKQAQPDDRTAIRLTF